MKTREQLIEEYSQLGNAAIPIAIYDVGEKLAREIASIGYDFNSEIRKNLFGAKESVKDACNAVRSIERELTDSYKGVFLHVRNFLRKN